MAMAVNSWSWSLNRNCSDATYSTGDKSRATVTLRLRIRLSRLVRHAGFEHVPLQSTPPAPWSWIGSDCDTGFGSQLNADARVQICVLASATPITITSSTVVPPTTGAVPPASTQPGAS
ncbi:hypothetical protein E4U26_001130 [Claviceps purpurea]|nr:hypothetical protein E4U26_001130 [Claviceps purpurea]